MDKEEKENPQGNFQPTSKNMIIPLVHPVSAQPSSPHFSLDFIYKKTLNEEKSLDIYETGEDIDEYWEKGWITNEITAIRSNFTEYNGDYHYVFPTRYLLKDFVLTKSLRRIMQRNRKLKTIVRPFRPTEKKDKLHQRFNFLRFNELPAESISKKYEYYSIFQGTLYEVCVFKEDKLIACSIFQLGTYSIHSNECFWDLNYPRYCLGTYTILLEINFAICRFMHYYYLGFYYPANPNFDYKTRFSGLELFDLENECWLKLADSKELLKRELPNVED
jgi:leucyl-tRNA---protein transferase